MKNQSFTWNVIQPAVKYVSNKMFRTRSNPVPILKGVASSVAESYGNIDRRAARVGPTGRSSTDRKTGFPAGVEQYLAAGYLNVRLW